MSESYPRITEQHTELPPSPESKEVSGKGFSKILGTAFESIAFPLGADNEEYVDPENDGIRDLVTQVKSGRAISYESIGKIEKVLSERLGYPAQVDDSQPSVWLSLVGKVREATRAVNSLAGESKYTAQDVLSVAEDREYGNSLIDQIHNSMIGDRQETNETVEPDDPEKRKGSEKGGKLTRVGRLMGRVACIFIAVGSIIGVAKGGLFDSDSEPVKNRSDHQVQVDEFKDDTPSIVEEDTVRKADESSKEDIIKQEELNKLADAVNKKEEIKNKNIELYTLEGKLEGLSSQKILQNEPGLKSIEFSEKNGRGGVITLFNADKFEMDHITTENETAPISSVNSSIYKAGYTGDFYRNGSEPAWTGNEKGEPYGPAIDSDYNNADKVFDVGGKKVERGEWNVFYLDGNGNPNIGRPGEQTDLSNAKFATGIENAPLVINGEPNVEHYAAWAASGTEDDVRGHNIIGYMPDGTIVMGALDGFNRRDLAENLAKMGLHGAGKEDGGGSRGAKIGEKTLDYGGENRWVRIIGIKPR